jgi:hypothetical protein
MFRNLTLKKGAASSHKLVPDAPLRILMPITIIIQHSIYLFMVYEMDRPSSIHNRSAYCVLRRMPEGKRSPERRRWEINIKTDLKEK